MSGQWPRIPIPIPIPCIQANPHVCGSSLPTVSTSIKCNVRTLNTHSTYIPDKKNLIKHEKNDETSTHGSLETFGGPQRHAIAHLKAGKMAIPNVIRYAGKIRPFLKFQYLCNIRNYFFLAGFKASSQSANVKYLVRTCSQHAGEQSCCSKY